MPSLSTTRVTATQEEPDTGRQYRAPLLVGKDASIIVSPLSAIATEPAPAARPRNAMNGAEIPKAAGPGSDDAADAGASLSDQVRGAPSPADRARFELLIGEQLDGLYRSALRLTRNRAAAEDLVQDVMLKSWRSFHTFQEGTSVRAWLHRILMNAFFDAHRKQTREPELMDQEDIGDFYLYDKASKSTALSEAGNPEALLEQIMDFEVRQSLEALPVQYRSAVLLADVEGFSHKEIADILSIPAGTVMSRLSRGRHLLQRHLWEYAKDRHLVSEDVR